MRTVITLALPVLAIALLVENRALLPCSTILGILFVLDLIGGVTESRFDKSMAAGDRRAAGTMLGANCDVTAIAIGLFALMGWAFIIALN
jgi:hypothetical protein